METLVLLAASGGHKAPPLVDIDGTVFIQFAIFLLLLIILNSFVFKPYLKVRQEQDENIQGAKDEAEGEERSADEKITFYEQQILTARKEAALGRAELRKEGEGAAQRQIAITRKEAEEKIQAARTKIAKTAPAAQLALRTRADQLAKAVASKVLGREV